jgi:cell division protein FtsI/penicillin-binding protein 2
MVLLAAFALAASARLAFWQVQRGPELRETAIAQLERPAEIPTERGRILDRNGRVLALTVYRDRLVAYPRLLVNPWDALVTEKRRASTLQSLTEILGLDDAGRAEVQELLAQGTTEYVVIDRQLTEAESAAVLAAVAVEETERQLWAVGLEPQPVRMYPNAGGEPGTTLASHLLGFVNTNGHGAYGIEEQYDAALAGVPTTVAAARDRFGRLLGSSARIIEPGRDGEDIHLTIDAGLQLQLEKELLAARNTDKAKRASALIMDPETGEILAWASVPGYDANDYATQWERNKEAFRDPMLSSSYEPGSVMKMFTAAAALDSKRMTLGKLVQDSGSLSFPPFTVRNADHKAMGWIPFRDVIAYSRNVATARTAARLGRNVPKSSAVLYRMWTRLGLGKRTGIDLANEAVGIVQNPATRPWAPIDLANRSFGQGVSVTQVQLAAGYTPMINGGFRVTPHFLASIDGQPAEKPTRERVLSAQVAGQLHSVLDHVTAGVPWYAEGSLIKGYQVGGKTGTAQIWQREKNRYSHDVFNFSFIGYVGGDKPEAVVAVRIEEAKAHSETQGAIELNITSYQLFNRIAHTIIDTLDLKKSSWRGAGFPEPLSAADKQLTPERYRQHQAQKRTGTDLQALVRDRYLPGGADRLVRADVAGATGKAKGDRAGTSGKATATKNGKADRAGSSTQGKQSKKGKTSTQRGQTEAAAGDATGTDPSAPDPSPSPNG